MDKQDEETEKTEQHAKDEDLSSSGEEMATSLDMEADLMSEEIKGNEGSKA